VSEIQTGSAYLTVSEVFPLETRALAIAFFYAIGTAAGGITGPLLFSSLVSTGKVSDTVLAFSIGAILMILAGIVEIFLGVKAERRGLEDIARPLTAEDPGTTPAPAVR
jgi:MFS family permease